MGKKSRQKRARATEPTPSDAAQRSPGRTVTPSRAPPAPIRLAPRRAPPWARVVLSLLATAYLLSVFLNGTKTGVAAKVLPRVPLYFSQIACLFPNAALAGIDYRLEVWHCGDRRFVELDPVAYFPIHPHDKENRFQRLLFFHRRDRLVMRSLEAHVIERENRARAALDPPGPSIGGIRALSLRHPIPPLGAETERHDRRPLVDLAHVEKKEWYWTPSWRRAAFCRGELPPEDPPQRRPSEPAAEPEPPEPLEPPPPGDDPPDAPHAEEAEP